MKTTALFLWMLLFPALLRAQGESRVTDTIFENRFACAEGFLRLGASVNVCGRTLHVHGMDLLNGADVEAPDLRGGAALVIAALQAYQPRLRGHCGAACTAGGAHHAQLGVNRAGAVAGMPGPCYDNRKLRAGGEGPAGPHPHGRAAAGAGETKRAPAACGAGPQRR